MKLISQKKAIFLLIIIFVVAFVGGIVTGNHFVYLKLGKWQAPQPIFQSASPDANLDYDLFWQVWSILKERYVEQPVTDKNLFYGSLKGLVSGLDDPYSNFLDPETAKRFLDEMSGNFEGIGIEIGIKDNRLTVIAPLPDTPAFRAGMRTGDKIYAIDDKDTSGMALDEAANLIRGKKGTKVKLLIWRTGDSSAQDLELIRDVISIKTVSWQLVGNNIALLKVSHFDQDTWTDFQNIAQIILKANPKGLILDLRNNPGGYLDTSVDIAGYWVNKDIVVTAKDAKGEVTEYRANGRGELKNLPIIVLVNGGSASASEILAGALQDYKLATLLGEKTFGKGSVQELENFADGSALKLTVAHWYTPLGRSINKEGITPDIKVELTEEDYKLNRDPQLQKAIEILEKK
ncbi:MAG: S41 family peptidase [Patescibacteria group bacterium]